MPTESIRSGSTWLQVTGCAWHRTAGSVYATGSDDGRCVTEQQSIVLRMTPPDHLLDAVWSFHLIPHWEDRRRL